jgi:hypothetical protein
MILSRSENAPDTSWIDSSSGALLEFEVFKKCTPLLHEPHFEVKYAKN